MIQLLSYIFKKKEEAADKIGIKVKKYILSKDSSEEEILEIVNFLNQDKQVNGILVQMPLPTYISSDRIIQAINPKKDVDGFLLKSKFDSPFVLAIQKAINTTGKDLRDKKIIALVNSDAFGKKLVDSLKPCLKKYILCKGCAFSGTASMVQADVIISALGQPNIIKSSMIKQDVILIDGGISRKNGKIVGDVDKKSVKEKAKWLSPVPGGIGPMTVAFLLKNVVLSIK